MSNSVLYMSMSLDGYIAGPDDRPGNPGGDRFMRLHEWYGFEESSTNGTGWGAHFLDESRATGAVLAGRRTVEQVDHWGGDNHGVPIIVPSHRPPGPSVANYPLVTYISDGIANETLSLAFKNQYQLIFGMIMPWGTEIRKFKYTRKERLLIFQR